MSNEAKEGRRRPETTTTIKLRLRIWGGEDYLEKKI
jgi:hypothetical protein